MTFLKSRYTPSQDVSPVQYRLLRLLVGATGSVVAVGDPDQSGESPEPLLPFFITLKPRVE